MITTSDQPESITLELCTGGIDDVQLAAAVGADRIELNCGMACGGLTASAAMAEAARRLFSGNIVAMVRPREGSFVYSQSEFLMMLRDAETLAAQGINGLAIGFLQPDGSVDQARTSRVRQILPQTELVFHRAFDWTPDRAAALEQLVDCGYTRILTGGGPGPACAEGLRELVRQAAGRIEIVACGGIRAHNVETILRCSGVTQVHSAARETIDPAPPHNVGLLHFGLPDFGAASYGRTSPAQLQELLSALKPWRTSAESGS